MASNSNTYYAFLAAFLLLAGSAPATKAQTCSCAGAPLINSQSMGTNPAGSLTAGITYEYHDISAIYSGTTLLDDNTVKRSTQSVLLEINYGISSRFSVSGTFSYVNKNRTTGLHLQTGGNTVTAGGPGDGILMLRYTLIEPSLWNPLQIAVGAGVKAPIGRSSLKNNGFTMNADMQPGTGAWDGVAWAFLSRSLRPDQLSAHLTASYRHTGSNERFGEGDNYKFGNELVADTGISGKLTETFSGMASLRYRITSSDRLNGIALPNTGGSWFQLIPAVNVSLSDRMSFRLSGRIPIHQNLSGTQPTTSYALSGSLFFTFNQDKTNGFNYGKPE